MSDPVKYTLYQEAVKRAIIDISQERKDIVVCVVGAGFGGLVESCLRAIKDVASLQPREKQSFSVIAVEKNPVAIQRLQKRVETELLWRNVRVYGGDMRDAMTCPLSGGVDIMVSELLGGFADNELSPECLEHADHLLRQGGISIPSSTTSFLAPLRSPLLRRIIVEAGKDNSEKWWVLNRLPGRMARVIDTVVPLRIPKGSVGVQVGECIPAFTFHHPNSASSPLYHNIELDFPCPGKGTKTPACHGLVGYFEAVLYKDVTLSTVPGRETLGLHEWFPVYFPLKQPVTLPTTVQMSRETDGDRVWYSWSAGSLGVAKGKVHNNAGAHCWMMK
jgi:protein arginine N-methyltransferase 5